MNITVAKHSGACYGVNRALDLVHKAAKNGVGVHTMGPLIHNPVVVEELRKEGIIPATSLDEITDGILVIRTHGVAPNVIKEAQSRGLETLDATCPHVTKAQNEAQNLAESGRFVVIVGEKGHPEVEALRAYAGENSIVVDSVNSLYGNLNFESVGVVVQTTQSEELFEEVVEYLKTKTQDIKISNTICFATRQRQAAACELSKKVEVMIVVGGKNSGNTRRLFEICSKECSHAYLIERSDELMAEWFEGIQEVGITAGASTPSTHIEQVISRIKTFVGE